MKVFVGFGDNSRDHWIEEHFFPILRRMGFFVVDGKDMHGETLQPEVQSRIEQSDAAIGSFTIMQRFTLKRRKQLTRWCFIYDV